VGQTTLTPLSLNAGQRYAFKLLMKEGGGGDYAQLAMRNVNDTTPAANLPVIGGSRVVGWANPQAGVPVIATQPQSGSVAPGGSLTLSVEVSFGERPLSYQHP
jgi:hypothetical protein